MPAPVFTALPDSDHADPGNGDLVASDGLTLDTALGSVDTVAIDRVLSGRPVALTAAEVAYLFALLPATLPAARPVAAALDLSPYTVRDRARRTALTATRVA